MDNLQGIRYISSVFGISAVENPVEKVENPANNASHPDLYVNRQYTFSVYIAQTARPKKRALPGVFLNTIITRKCDNI